MVNVTTPPEMTALATMAPLGSLSWNSPSGKPLSSFGRAKVNVSPALVPSGTFHDTLVVIRSPAFTGLGAVTVTLVIAPVRSEALLGAEIATMAAMATTMLASVIASARLNKFLTGLPPSCRRGADLRHLFDIVRNRMKG